MPEDEDVEIVFTSERPEKTFTVVVPGELWARVEALCALKGMTIDQFICQMFQLLKADVTYRMSNGESWPISSN